LREIERTFQNLRAKGEGALIGYVTGGDPEPRYTPRIVEALVNGGVDIIELGIPFSDPIADGPTIQAASVRALEAGTTPETVLKIAGEVKRKHEVPIVILTYYNPIFRMGLDGFFKMAKNFGVDGLIVPDLPIEEAHEYKKVADAYGIDTIFLAAPSTSKERLRKILAYTSGFLYLVSVFGVTGTRESVQDITIRLIKRALSTAGGKTPLAVGFGISKPEHVKTVILNGADGAIVGSRFVKVIEKNLNNERGMLEEIRDYAHKLKKATVKET
jgi:tryptophan synthase alpha chain